MRVGRAGASVIARTVFDLHVEGRHRLPTGPFVLAGTHYSHLDAPIGYVAVGRPIRYLAVDEIYGLSPSFDRLLLFFGTIPMAGRRWARCELPSSISMSAASSVSSLRGSG